MKTLDQHIVAKPGGIPCIAGNSIAVRTIAVWHERMGKGAAEIAAENNMTLADVHAALAYYFDHQAEIDRSIDEMEPLEEVASEPAGLHLIERFVAGVATVLEFFPPPERLNAWRLGHDQENWLKRDQKTK